MNSVSMVKNAVLSDLDEAKRVAFKKADPNEAA